ncbi:MAG: DMT family transporter [Pseudomonadota bacterium]|nr:DMT family transporter [Pseudomonadota bacterium]
MADDDRKGLFLGLVGVTIFGLTLPATRLAVEGLDPYVIALGRGIVAAAIAALALRLSGESLPPRSTLVPLVICAAGVVLGFPLFATLAMQYVPASHGGVVLAILPLATAVAGVLVAGERPSPGFWLCGVLGSVAVLAFTLAADGGGSGLHLADLLLVAAVISAGVGYAYGGVLARTLGGWQTISWALVISTPVLALLLIVLQRPVNWSAPAAVWAGFLYLAIASQFFGFFAWYRGLALGGVAKVGQTQLLQPFITLAASALLLSETITPLEIGFALVVVGIVAAGRRMRVDRIS